MMQERIILIAAATFAGLISHAGVGRADTISYADAVTVLAKDCGADIKKLCKGVNLGGGGIQSCIEANAAKVSPTCTATLSRVIASIKQRQEAQAAYSKICRHDISQYCNDIVGDGNVLACLIETDRVDSRKCNEAITDAGWR
ncbi:hypothetical protein J3P71_29880 (plasmid) [Rhizobium leguminosarum]|uniref:hypothetical protein n=1 Tax=Rhizobium leguminosarum TaxID=384 RepID=UPI0014412A6F|nr:hypothetical protein [Rhizobium leguminosarum]MBY5835711.1 hypothetical protein [Rhizobium leguminosarum]NKM82170.1 hypothetical protein [Rhizobium leguminosarum bv. viciae]QSZ11911.1 hypothetical protein J3P71_29880 [Rhizobium leguminosarum]